MAPFLGEDPNWLYTQFSQGANILVVDCRPFSDYGRGHVEGSINISVPSLMLRRLKRGNIPIKNFISSQVAKQKFDDRRQAEKIVVYDEESSVNNLAENPIVEFLLDKLAADNSVALLDGGFRRFEECFPHLCQCGEDDKLGNSIFSLANLTLCSNDVIPSPIPSCDTNNNIAPIIENSKDLLFRPDSLGPIQIIPRLYLGNKKDSSVFKSLKNVNITHVLNVTHDLPNVFEDKLEYLQLPVQDNWDGNVMDLFPRAFSFIEKAMDEGGSVLVHCLGGISRSSTIIIAYLMLKYNYSLNDAYDHVKSKKSNIAPNFNFMGQLLDFERSLSESQAQTMFCLSPGSKSPGSFSNGSNSSVDSNESC